MLSWRYFLTKVGIQVASMSLRHLIATITSARDQKVMQYRVQSGRERFDMMRFWLKRNPDAEMVSRSQIEGCWVTEYAPKTGYEHDDIVIFFHGGGFVVGGDATHGPFASDLAHALSCRVFLIEYPLAPESQLAATIQTCFTITKTIQTQSNCTHYVMMGSSAGGSIASHVIAKMVNDKEIAPKALYLIGPVIQHCFDFDEQKYRDLCTSDELLGPSYRFLLDNPQNKERAIAILGGEQACGLLHLQDEVLRLFPPTHITYQREEVLAAEIQAFIQRLRHNQVHAVDNIVDNAFHSFNMINYLPQTKAYISTVREHMLPLRSKKPL